MTAKMIAGIEAQIRTAYATLDNGHGVKLADLREAIGGYKTVVNMALENMAAQPGIHFRAEADQKTLTERDHAAALRLGGTMRHTLKIENWG